MRRCAVRLSAAAAGVANNAARTTDLAAPNPFRVMPDTDATPSMQRLYWGTGPTTGGVCYGCGPANDKGLQLRSYVSAEEYDAATGAVARLEAVARFQPEPHHNAFPNVLNGGVIATLLDCHLNLLASYYVMRARAGPEATELPALTVTARFEMDLKRPTPMDEGPVCIWGEVDLAASDVAKGSVWLNAAMYAPSTALKAEVRSDAKPTALSRGRFVAPRAKM